MTYIILALIAVILLAGIGIYNRFKRLEQQTKAAIANIDVALAKRHDTLINIVEVVKGYSKHERETLVELVETRSHDLAAMADKDDKETAATAKLLALAEAYPELQANENFLHLQKVIADTEEHLQAARRLYNQSVKEFNIGLAAFPSNLIAGMMDLRAKPYYTADPEQRENVNIKI